MSKLNDFRVAVLDLYKGKIGVDAEEASHVSVLPPRIAREIALYQGAARLKARRQAQTACACAAHGEFGLQEGS